MTDVSRTDILRPTRFELVGLSILDVGPLRGTTRIDFVDVTGKPTNLYLVMGPNGAGKTTVLEALYTAMAMLSATSHAETGIGSIDTGQGGIQLDALVQLDDGSRSFLRMLSIVIGAPGLLKTWTSAELEMFGADSQIQLHYARRLERGPFDSAASQVEAKAFLAAILERADETLAALFGQSMTLPTLLYFPSDRGIRRPPTAGRNIVRPGLLNYAPARRFDIDGLAWADSIENLLVWYTWLGDKRDQVCRDLVRDLVFRGAKSLGEVDRQNLSVPVKAGDHSHRLDQLSSGERQLVQLVVRIVTHMTASTIVLIDETEQHLHTVMRRRLINIIMDWARDFARTRFDAPATAQDRRASSLQERLPRATQIRPPQCLTFCRSTI
jgi:energy-coupling factor transporter ATP-binding protein EcfA2